MVEKPEKPRESSGQALLFKPLPQVLDELEALIERTEEAAKMAQDAATTAAEAGRTAAAAVQKAADAALAKLESKFGQAMDDRVGALRDEVRAELQNIHNNAAASAAAIDQALLAAKNVHAENSPHLKK